MALTPRLRCAHGAGAVVGAADAALTTGRAAHALDAYLRALADHPRTGFCDRVLHARAAEAALAARCPQIARDLASAAARGAGERPIGADAALTARALALLARALLALGRTEAAAGALRRAQSTVQRDKAVDQLVRLSAAQVHLVLEAPFDDLERATAWLTSMLGRHQLNPAQPGVMPSLLISLGRTFLQHDRLEPACESFDMAGRFTGVTGWVAAKGILALAGRHPEADRRMRYAAADWAEALCEEAHCRAAMGIDCAESDAPLVFGLAATSAANRGDAETAARLSASCTYLDGLARTGQGVWTVPGEPPADSLFLFADHAAQRRWAALHQGVHGIRALATAGADAEPDADVDVLPPRPVWWAERSDAAHLRAVAREAHGVFGRLSASDPETFRAMYDRAIRTIAHLESLLGEEPILSRRRTSRLETSASVLGPVRPAPDGGSAAADWKKPPGALGLPAFVPAPYKDMTTATPSAERARPGAFARPSWSVVDAGRPGADCWTALTAAAEAHRLGHGLVGSEHLLLAVSEDADCAGLLGLLGITRAAVLRCVTALLGPDPERRAELRLSERAGAVLALAAGHALARGAGRVRPLHVLGALTLDGMGVGAQILTSLGADHDEILVRIRLHTSSAPDGPTPSAASAGWVIGGLPSLRDLTAPTRRSVARAVDWAAASPGGLLDPSLLLRAIAAEGWDQTRRPAAGPSGMLPSGPPRSPEHALPDASVPAPDNAGGSTAEVGSTALRVTPTPAARRVLAAASKNAQRQGRQGVDLDDVVRAILRDGDSAESTGARPAPGAEEGDRPPPDTGARGVLDSARAAAESGGQPYIGPEHLRTALEEAGDRPCHAQAASPGTGLYPGAPLPLTPGADRALASAAALARAAGRAGFTAGDLAQALSEVAPLPNSRPAPPSHEYGSENPTERDTADEEPERPDGQPFHPDLVRHLKRALATIDRETTNLLSRGHSTDGDEAEYRRRLEEVLDAQGEQLEILRLLHRHAPGRHVHRLIEVLTTVARRRRGFLACAALDQAAGLARLNARPHQERTVGLARVLTELGVVHQESGRWREALVWYDEALGLLEPVQEPDGGSLAAAGMASEAGDLRGWTLGQRARCLSADGPDSETAALLLVAAHHRLRMTGARPPTRLGPMVTEVAHVAGRLGELGRHDQALVVASGTIKTVGAELPELAAVHDERARALSRLNRGDLGRADLDHAVRLAPDDPSRLSARGAHLLWTGGLDEAIADFDRALALSPASVFPLHLRGEAFRRAGRLTEALADLDTVARDGGSPSALLCRGQVRRELGDVEGALRDLTAAGALDPDCAWTRYEYALGLFVAGCPEQARLQTGAAIRQGTARYREFGPWRFTHAANLAVFHTALGAGRQACHWLGTAFNYRHHPWGVADFHDDLVELARALPERAGLCAELSRAAGRHGP
ncbi:tetratricopeptide repeat protein [Streptomyces fuscichromogenes]|uniref:tetratricopeptide repeat protein n=1 Tax=Streptomyces fuscichromogenes TaxID=1324013 RepID=UPI00167171F1|nr:tetratricopeptide repeat protein [Streptomyces fuscichromogenes]